MYHKRKIEIMKVSLTRKEILTLANTTGMFFNPNMSKSGMLQFVEAGLKGDNKRAILFAQSVMDAEKQKNRDKALNSILN